MIFWWFLQGLARSMGSWPRALAVVAAWLAVAFTCFGAALWVGLTVQPEGGSKDLVLLALFIVGFGMLIAGPLLAVRRYGPRR